MSVLTALQAARVLIAKPEAWLHNGMYNGRREVDSFGRATVATCGTADVPNCFCISGALTFAGGGDAFAAKRFLHDLIPDGRPVTEWNDHYGRTHAEVLALFDEGIALLQAPKGTK